MASSGKKRTRNSVAFALASATSTPNQSVDFISLCRQENIQVPSTLTGCKSFLSTAQVVKDIWALSKQPLVELSAALLWARHHLHDPAEWENVDQSMRDQLTSLFSILNFRLWIAWRLRSAIS
jgi:hypothetical protein